MSQDTSAKILRKINEAKRDLGGKNVQGCLMHFKAGLEIAAREPILPQDKKAVQEEIERLQNEIQNNHAFKEIYGPVTFAGSEFDVTLAFVKQLIQASAEELFESTDLAQMKDGQIEEPADVKAPASGSNGDLLAGIMKKIEDNDLDGAREMIGVDEELMDQVIDALNNDGISLRSSGKYDKALAVYSKGIELRPNEEGLYYNMARASFEKGDSSAALGYLNQVLKMNPDFGPGKDLRGYIQGRQAASAKHEEAGNGSESEFQPPAEKKSVFSALKSLIGRKAH